MKQSRNIRGYALSIIAGIFWGVSGTFVQFLLQKRGLTSEWLVSVRLLVAGTLLLILSAAKGDSSLRSIWMKRNDVITLLIFSIFGMLGVQYTFFLAIQHSNAATATIIQFLGPVMITVYLAIINKKLPPVSHGIAILLAIAGTVLLVTHGSFSGLAISGAGLFWGLTSAVTLAFYSLQPTSILKRFNVATIVGYSMVIGGLALSLTFSHPWQIPGRWDAGAYLAVAFIFIPGTLIAFYAYLVSVKEIGAQIPSLLVSVEPVSAAILSVCWLGVPFAWSDLAGTALILATVFLLTKK